MTARWIRPLFVVAALYDSILGITVALFALPVYHLFGVEPVNHLGYVQFPALMLLIFAALFFRIASDPAGNRHLIPYGIALKVAYSGLVFWYQLTGGVPSMWIPWAWIDLGFLVLFVVAWRQVGRPAHA
jgi:hypothetical protein